MTFGRFPNGTGATAPSRREALEELFRAFPSWFMRVTCERCGKDRMLNERAYRRYASRSRRQRGPGGPLGLGPRRRSGNCLGAL